MSIEVILDGIGNKWTKAVSSTWMNLKYIKLGEKTSYQRILTVLFYVLHFWKPEKLNDLLSGDVQIGQNFKT